MRFSTAFRSWRRRLTPLLDEAQSQGRLRQLAPGLLLAALEQESGAPPADAARSSLAEAIARRLGEDAASVAAAAAPAPPPDLSGLTGELYLELLARLEPLAGRDGQVFTPWPLARHLAGLLEPAPGQRWLDPAAGAGIFLQAAVALGLPPEACAALEPDPLAAWIGQGLVPRSRWRGGDALADWSGLPAHWRGGFERVILNPPYRNGVERRDPAWTAWREQLKTRFATARGPFDLYVPFVERALDFLAPGGRLGLLLPGAWLATDYGLALRRLLSERTRLLRLQHAPGLRPFARADFELLLLVVERRPPAGPEPPLLVERLDRGLVPVERHAFDQETVAALAPEGWGPLLCPPARRRLRARTPALGEAHDVRASLSADEYYRLEVREGEEPGPGQLLLLSSGALEPFRHTWREREIRFRGARWRRPLVESATLPPTRRAQTERPRVLVANLSRRLEALAVPPGSALGVVNVVQVFCPDLERAHALAAWLNSAPLQEHVRTWHEPRRLSGQLSLTRGLVRALPAPPDPAVPAQARDAERLGELGRRLAERAAAGLGLDPAWLGEVDAIVARYMPLDTASPGAC